jgi:hypothetical protein
MLNGIRVALGMVRTTRLGSAPMVATSTRGRAQSRVARPSLARARRPAAGRLVGGSGFDQACLSYRSTILTHGRFRDLDEAFIKCEYAACLAMDFRSPGINSSNSVITTIKMSKRLAWCEIGYFHEIILVELPSVTHVLRLHVYAADWRRSYGRLPSGNIGAERSFGWSAKLH